MIEKQNYIEPKEIKELAFEASNLRYDALARLIDELTEANIENEWNLDTNALIDAKEALERAYDISIKHTSSEALAKHPDSHNELRSEIIKLKSKNIHSFLILLVRKLNDDAEKDFQKGYKKLCKVMLTGERSTIRSLRRALGFTHLNI